MKSSESAKDSNHNQTTRTTGPRIAAALAAILAAAAAAPAAEPLTALLAAIRTVESAGNDRAVGDNGRAIGPYQLHKPYWTDGGGDPARYRLDAWNAARCRPVILGYWKRYAPAALEAADAETLARIHNGGPRGHRKAATLAYWRKVRAALAAAKTAAAKTAAQPPEVTGSAHGIEPSDGAPNPSDRRIVSATAGPSAPPQDGRPTSLFSPNPRPGGRPMTAEPTGRSRAAAFYATGPAGGPAPRRSTRQTNAAAAEAAARKILAGPASVYANLIAIGHVRACATCAARRTCPGLLAPEAPGHRPPCHSAVREAFRLAADAADAADLAAMEARA